MKIRNQHIAKLVSNLKRSPGSLRSPQIMHPQREWVIGVVVGAVILLTLTSWSAATYIAYRSPALDVPEDGSFEPTAYRGEQVNQALEELSARTARHEALLAEAAPAEAPTQSATTTEQAATASSTEATGPSATSSSSSAPVASAPATTTNEVVTDSSPANSSSTAAAEAE